jgi:DNA-binding transcriptional regulator of glucitol operon
VNYTHIFIIIAVAYAIQIFLTGWQAKRFFRRMKKLRKNGIASIGQAGGKWVGRTFAVIVVDENLNIINAEELSGITVFSKLKSVGSLVGINLKDFLKIGVFEKNNKFNLKKKQFEAFKNAAQQFFDKEGQIVSEVSRIL